jgi:hypothetical protein
MNLLPYPNRKRFIAAIIIFFILSLIILFGARGMILRKAISSINTKVSHHHYRAHWDGARFKGLNTIFVKGIYIQHESDDNEVIIDSLAFQVRIIPLFFKQVRIRKLGCKVISIRYHSGDSLIQHTPVIRTDSTDLLDRIMGDNLADIANSSIRRLFSYTPAKAKINKIEVRLLYAGNTTVIGLRDFQMAKGKMTAQLILTGNASSVQIPFEGKFDKSFSLIEVHLANADSNLLPVPVLWDKYGIAAGFDSLDFMLNMAHRSRHAVNVEGIFSFAGFELNGDRLSTDNISIGHFRSSFRLNIGTDYVEIDSTTHAYLNRIELNPYFRLLLARER